MPVDLTIKGVPDELAKRLSRRAARHHRSVQSEILAVLEEHLAAEGEPLTLTQALDWTKKAGLSTPAESVAMIREDRHRGRTVKRMQEP